MMPDFDLDVLDERCAGRVLDERAGTRHALSNAAERALLATARTLAAQLTVQGACTVALQALEEVFGATAAWIMLHDSSTNALQTVLFRGDGGDVYRGLSIPTDSRSLMARAFSAREALFVPDVNAESNWFDSTKIHQSRLRSLFMLPIVYEDRPLGVIALDSPRLTVLMPPDQLDVEAFEAFAAQLAIALTNARLYEKSEQDRQRLRTLLTERRQPSDHGDRLRKESIEISSGRLIVGASEVFVESVHQAGLVAPADTTVLLLGETGTGKDLLARLIHERSRRAHGPFVAVNCAALPENLVESELFGHERGAFTGALARKAGSFELASRGTLFLDEIGDLPLEAQAKLLRVLQDRQVQRIGASRPVTVDVRVIAATNQHLEGAIVDKRFRPDLFYRLSVFPIRIPALRDRREDIRLLAEHFLCHFARKQGKNVVGFTSDALDRLHTYDWPGNIRELQNVVERAVILAGSSTLDADGLYLPAPIVQCAHESSRASGRNGQIADTISEPLLSPAVQASPVHNSEPLTLADADRVAILEALNSTRWRISGRDGAAERLGLKPTTLHAKMKKLGIRRPTPVVPPLRPRCASAPAEGWSGLQD